MFSVAVLFLLCVAPVPATGSLRCRAGWFGGNVDREIPDSRINDGYCDCPLDGADEVETGACAGSMDGGWAGVQASAPGAGENRDSKLQCPQQKSLVPLSRIGDGICDCCDGADEPQSTNCPDICDTVLAEERAARFKAEADFAAGSKKRKDEMEEFAKMLEETTAQIESLSKDNIPKLEDEVNYLDGQIRDAKLTYMAERFAAVKEIQDSLAFLGEVVSMDEITSFIIMACQLAGEIFSFDSKATRLANQKSCVPLRLAGLDVGIIWEDENFSEYSASSRRIVEGDDGSMMEFATLLDKNAGGDENTSFGRDDAASHHTYDHNRHRDRHQYDDIGEERPDYADDDEYPYEADDDYPHNYPGYNEDEEDQDQRKATENTEDQVTPEASEAQVDEEKTEEKSREQIVREVVQSNAVFASRAPFKSRAKELMDKIDLIRKEEEKGETEEDGDEAEEGEEETAKGTGETPQVDPMAIQMISGSLSRHIHQLERGEDFATSAKILLDALQEAEKEDVEDLKRYLTNLAIGTVYHGKLSAEDVSELFFAMIPELRRDNAGADDTCSSAYSNMCPPQTVTRQDFSLPPAVLVTAAESLCKERSAASMTCSGGANDAGEDGIPSSIPDGYYGYYLPKSRESADVLNEYFAPLDNLTSKRVQTSELEKDKSDRETRLNELRDEVRDLEKRIGGRDELKFGPGGELYGIRDSCHKVESGKYEYELCIFGKATQRDKGQKGGGTNLGRWTGMKRDEATGERVMTWEKGMKCWNGPQRSATVRVTCGLKNKILTADEPRTCEYEMKMESHVACDDKFKELHNL